MTPTLREFQQQDGMRLSMSVAAKIMASIRIYTQKCILASLAKYRLDGLSCIVALKSATGFVLLDTTYPGSVAASLVR